MVIGVQIPASAAVIPFVDVKFGSWYSISVQNVVNLNIMVGTGKNSDVSSINYFFPERDITRGEFATVMKNLFVASKYKEITVTGTNTFADVREDVFYTKPVTWAAELKIVEGYGDNTFRPEAKITREEAAVMISNYLKATETELKEKEAHTPKEYIDSSLISTWAKEAVDSLQYNGIMIGDDKGDFNPKSSITRAEVAALLDNLLYDIKDWNPAIPH